MKPDRVLEAGYIGPLCEASKLEFDLVGVGWLQMACVFIHFHVFVYFYFSFFQLKKDVQCAIPLGMNELWDGF